MTFDRHTKQAPALTRRRTLAALAVLPLAAACTRPRTRAEIVHSLSQDLPREDLAALDSANARMVESLERALNTVGTAELDAARARFREALLAWERASCFPDVGLTNSHALLRALFWPVHVGAVESLAFGREGVDQRFVGQLGVNRKGMFALELLLFGRPGRGGHPLVETEGETGARARALSLALATNIAACARSASSADPEPPTDPEQMLTHILSHMSGYLGSMASGKLSRALGPTREQRPSEVRGYASGTSFDILGARIAGAERVYLGPSGVGLSSLVEATTPEIDRHLRKLFQATRGAITRASAAPGQLELLAAARATVRSLDVAVESELASALGLTLLFNGNDAD